MIDLEYKICSFMIFYILFLKHTICHRFRIQNDIFHILLPKQISSLGTVSGRFLGPRGVQIPSTMELKDNGRWRPRVLDELCRSIFPYNRTNFGGSPRTKEYNYSKPRSRRGPRWEDRRRRGLPIRPYLHARMPRITAVEQLPQMSQKL